MKLKDGIDTIRYTMRHNQQTTERLAQKFGFEGKLNISVLFNLMRMYIIIHSYHYLLYTAKEMYPMIRSQFKSGLQNIIDLCVQFRSQMNSNNNINLIQCSYSELYAYWKLLTSKQQHVLCASRHFLVDAWKLHDMEYLSILNNHDDDVNNKCFCYVSLSKDDNTMTSFSISSIGNNSDSESV